MARFPRADWRPIPENATQPAITPRLFIAHTAIDGQGTQGLYNWWNSAGNNLESHFYVQKLGGVEQYMDSAVRADANNKANTFAISAETWDGRAPNKPENPWTDLQVVSLIDLIDWACRTHGIPRRLADRWDGSGLGYHNQYPQWSTGGTSCPGSPRRDQLIDVIIPAVASLTNSAAPPTPPRKKDKMFEIVRMKDGALCRFATYFGAITHQWQPKPNSGPWEPWQGLGNEATAPGAFDSMTVAVNEDGRMEIIAWHSAYGVAFTCYQLVERGGWSPWQKV